MSYQVIARKWRPQIFEEVIGQESVTQTLRNAIEHERLHHAYIFSGARGVGKTTTARLVAKALNCHKTDKANPQPCDTSSDEACPSCNEIAESRSIDVFEFDAASHTGVDDIREIILESVNIGAARDRYKVFIIDEVHMLSKSSFNALLKTLEEPPQNVVFVMATTELHKVPDTILSRVQEFEFRTIPLQKIIDRLKTIADAEKIDIVDVALKEIARSGEGSMRDAQSNFDQVISFSGEKIEVDEVIKALGIASAENLTTTIKAIAEKNPQTVLKVVDDLIARGQDLRHFCTDLLTFIRDLLVFKMAGDADNLLDTAILGFDELKEHSEPFTESDLIRFFNSLAETESKLREANEPRYMLEVGLIKLIEMRRVQSVEILLERLSKLETALGNSEIKIDSLATPSTSKPAQGALEKKTLKTDLPIDEVPVRTGIQEPKVENATPKEVETVANVESGIVEQKVENSKTAEDETSNEKVTRSAFEKLKKQTIINIDSMPVKLEPIDSEELAHTNDKWLDNVYDYKLRHEGDDLGAIPNAGKIIQELLNIKEDSQVSENSINGLESNDSATTPVRATQNKALDIVADMTRHEEIDETIPEFPKNPTEENLLTYANNHPSVKKVIKIFRGRLVKVSKHEKSS